MALTVKPSRPMDLCIAADNYPLILLRDRCQGGIKEQTRQSLLNAKAILRERGLDLNNVVKTTVLLSDIANFGPMNEVYAELFSALRSLPVRPLPCATCPRMHWLKLSVLLRDEGHGTNSERRHGQHHVALRLSDA